MDRNGTMNMPDWPGFSGLSVIALLNQGAFAQSHPSDPTSSADASPGRVADGNSRLSQYFFTPRRFAF
ncbi:MAG: hypothetical protein Q7S51_08245 [Gallionellaceae bacterium]|nr:hypothetical protein [Gallionellaceae bacterium]